MTLKLDNSIPKDPYTKQLCYQTGKKDLFSSISISSAFQLKVLNISLLQEISVFILGMAIIIMTYFG